jgi:hypothetical protein
MAVGLLGVEVVVGMRGGECCLGSDEIGALVTMNKTFCLFPFLLGPDQPS